MKIKGYYSSGDHVYQDGKSDLVPVHTEKDFFKILRIPFINPEDRETILGMAV